MLDGIPRHHDDRLIVGYDKSDDASVYVVRDDLAIVQSVDFFRLLWTIRICSVKLRQPTR